MSDDAELTIKSQYPTCIVPILLEPGDKLCLRLAPSDDECMYEVSEVFRYNRKIYSVVQGREST